MKFFLQRFLPGIFFLLTAVTVSWPGTAPAAGLSHRELVETFSSLEDRRTGSTGNRAAAHFILDYLKDLGLKPETQSFGVPARRIEDAHITINGTSTPIQPFLYNAITPEGTDGPLEGPLYYVGTGSLENLKGIPVKGSIILLDFDSGIAWQHLASLGAKAAILVNNGQSSTKHFFDEKTELSPIQFPLFYMEQEQATQLFHTYTGKKTATPLIAQSVSLDASIVWQERMTDNIYCFIPGSAPSLENELLVVEAFYDNSSFLPGNAPGADEATSIVTLLKTAETLTQSPPGRPVLLLATSGHDKALAGMREFIWTLQTDADELQEYHQLLLADMETAGNNLEVLRNISFPLQPSSEENSRIQEAIKNTLKASVDEISRRLVHLRLNRGNDGSSMEIQRLVDKRFTLRQLGWKTDFSDLSAQEAKLLKNLLPESMAEHQKIINSGEKHLQAFQTTGKLKEHSGPFNIAAVISLHLSSHGSGVGAFHEGWLYQLSPRINRTGIYSQLGDVLRQSATTSSSSTPYVDSIRPSRMRTWDTWFLGKPFHGGEVSSLAGYLGITLATTGDGRHLWGTPWDTAENINRQRLEEQERLISHLIIDVSRADQLATGKSPRNGFSTISGRANLLLQGELFAEYPAYNTTLMAFQGEARFYSSVDTAGRFMIKGVSDNKNVRDKVIIEGYRFDEASGRVKWAIDKEETGKSNYRVKVRRKHMKTDLTFFSATGTTIFGTLEPRNFMYMTKLDLLDGRRDAPPQHYWYSRIDTRESVFTTIFTEPGTWLKLTLSETVLTRKFILSNSTKKSPVGHGYPVDRYSAIHNSTYHAARDMWGLLQPRIANLANHGIVDPQMDTLEQQGLAALEQAERSLEQMDYVVFQESALQALALAGRVYVQVEQTQKDVLFGVLFYIALFIPFAFCMERFLFNYANIYKRIVAFMLLLAALIIVIYNVHPAFQLAYSPTVVILAFFIIGLSLLVTLIIFFRFEEEMILLQRHASHQRPSEISRWKAFVAAFFLGVSNLRKRRLRSILTCITLIILTFTIMSFTTVKSSNEANTMLFEENAPYTGLLLKTINWQGLPRQAKSAITADLENSRTTAARVWLDSRSQTRPIQVPLQVGNRSAGLQGLIGMTPAEPAVTGIDTILTAGRWFLENDRNAIILEADTARELGINFTTEGPKTLELWGYNYEIIGLFSAKLLEQQRGLDGEPLTPVTFPQENSTWMSAAEQEAMATQDEVRTMQSRYRHLDSNAVAFLPADTLLAMGGQLKSVAIKPDSPEDIQQIGRHLVQRFNLPVFAGTSDGVWLYSPTSTLSYSGVPNIVIPLAISILIVLNTMISSVYERKNEIAVYTSVGLAPSHVSFLFIAEAMALAVISVVLGYLLAQVSAAMFASTSYWQGITVNYSSLAGVAAMVLVMAVVLISVIYPSKVAANIAIPDVKQTFKLPAPVNNRIEVVLPFYMKFAEHLSIGGFIYSYLAGHQDISHGKFSTGPVDIIFSCSTVDEIKQMVDNTPDPATLNCMHIQAKVWLAPFDFGIMQKVDIQFCPARQSKDYLEIKLTLQRQSGEMAMWQRINTMFLHDIRKQLLIWRSIDDEGHNYYAGILQRKTAEEEEVPREAGEKI